MTKTRIHHVFSGLLFVYVTLIYFGVVVYQTVSERYSKELRIQEGAPLLKLSSNPARQNMTRWYYESTTLIGERRLRQDKEQQYTEKRTHNPTTDSNLPGFYTIQGTDVYVSSVFHDKRYGDSMLRILAMVPSHTNTSIVCYFKDQGGYVISSKLSIYPSWPGDVLYEAVIYSCTAPSLLPVTRVKIGEYSAQIQNQTVVTANLKSEQLLPFGFVQPNTTSYSNNDSQEPNRGYTTSIPVTMVKDVTEKCPPILICVKAAGGNLQPESLAEWIELYRILGVDHFAFYNSSLGSAASRVLDRYNDMGVVHLVQFPLQHKFYDTVKLKQGGNLSKALSYSLEQQAYLLSMNDCLFRFSGRYQWILNVDLDEILVPIENQSLPSLAEKLSLLYNHTAGFLFKTAWYFDDFTLKKGTYQLDFSLITGLWRSPPAHKQPKVLYKPEAVMAVNWHCVIQTHRRSGLTTNYALAWDAKYTGAFIHHFRKSCIEKFYRDRCEWYWGTLKVDTVLPRYLRHLKDRILKVLPGLYPDIGAGAGGVGDNFS